MSDKLTYTVDGHVAHLTINRPNRRNAIDLDVVRGLGEALAQAEADEDVRAVVLSGAGDRAFCAGADLGGMTASGKVGQHFERAELGELLKQIRASRLPVIGRINGLALAGGFGLVLACDLVIAVDDAEFGTPEIDVGLWPFMITALIHRSVPRKASFEMMLTGRRISAEEGRQLGFVNRVVSRDELDSAVNELAEQIASKSPLVVSLGKRSFYKADGLPFEAALEYLAGMLTLCLESEDTVEGVSAFLEKRAPEWKGR
ncbi:MAG: enoyl-CoA hydratase/isomerase family protein [Actinomycetota bacterium]